MFIDSSHVRLTAHRFSAKDLANTAFITMLVLFGVMHLLIGFDHQFAADTVELGAILSLMTAGIALMFMPDEMPLMRIVSTITGTLLTSMCFAIAFILLRVMMLDFH
jgi:hypothetical protein